MSETATATSCVPSCGNSPDVLPGWRRRRGWRSQTCGSRPTGEDHAVHANGGDWLTAWHPPQAMPDGTRHGASGFCVTEDGGVVLISNDGRRWDWPGGRPEADETWEQTFRREMLEETCSVVGDARLLDSAVRSACRGRKAAGSWFAPCGAARSRSCAGRRARDRSSPDRPGRRPVRGVADRSWLGAIVASGCLRGRARLSNDHLPTALPVI